MLIALGDGDPTDDECKGEEEGAPLFLTDENNATEDSERWNEVDIER